MTPQDFAVVWGEPLTTAVPGPWTSRCSAAAAYWLTVAGLPAAAAPFLTFGPHRGTSWLAPLGAASWGAGAPEVVDSVLLGATGNDDPIVLVESGEVMAFNHDNDFSAYVLGSSLPQLCECLVLFRDLIHKGASPRALYAGRRRLRGIDARACADWWDEQIGFQIEEAKEARRPTKQQIQEAANSNPVRGSLALGPCGEARGRWEPACRAPHLW
jgi:hypothetical protein